MYKGTIVITGGTGFVGSHIISSLRNEYKFINIGRNPNLSCENVYWNLTDELLITRENIDMVIHCASIVGDLKQRKGDYVDVNVKSTIQLLEFCLASGVKKFIYLSTGGVYGYSNEIIDENQVCDPRDLYSLSKYFSEKICNLYKNEISITILRLFFPYGYLQKERLFNLLLDKITKGNIVTLNQDGFPIINPIHIYDVVNIIHGIIEREIDGIFNVSGEEVISIREVCYRIARVANVGEPKIQYNDSKVQSLIGNNTKILSILNYSMNMDLESGINQFLNKISN